MRITCIAQCFALAGVLTIGVMGIHGCKDRDTSPAASQPAEQSTDSSPNSSSSAPLEQSAESGGTQDTTKDDSSESESGSR